MIQDDYLRLQKNLPTTPPPPKGFVDLRYSTQSSSLVSVDETGAESPLGGSSGTSAAKSVSNAAARLALSLESAQGFAVVDADTGKTWMLVDGGTPSVSGDWLQLGDRDITAADITDPENIVTATAALAAMQDMDEAQQNSARNSMALRSADSPLFPRTIAKRDQANQAFAQAARLSCVVMGDSWAGNPQTEIDKLLANVGTGDIQATSYLAGAIGRESSSKYHGFGNTIVLTGSQTLDFSAGYGRKAVVFYSKSAGAGTFRVQQQIGSGSWTDLTTGQATAATPVVATTDTVNVTAGSFVVGEVYEITDLGVGTDFTAIGAASNTVGVGFVATGAGTGTGTASAIDCGVLEIDWASSSANTRQVRIVNVSGTTRIVGWFQTANPDGAGTVDGSEVMNLAQGGNQVTNYSLLPQRIYTAVLSEVSPHFITHKNNDEMTTLSELPTVYDKVLEATGYDGFVIRCKNTTGSATLTLGVALDGVLNGSSSQSTSGAPLNVTVSIPSGTNYGPANAARVKSALDAASNFATYYTATIQHDRVYVRAKSKGYKANLSCAISGASGVGWPDVGHTSTPLRLGGGVDIVGIGAHPFANSESNSDDAKDNFVRDTTLARDGLYISMRNALPDYDTMLKTGLTTAGDVHLTGKGVAIQNKIVTAYLRRAIVSAMGPAYGNGAYGGNGLFNGYVGSVTSPGSVSRPVLLSRSRLSSNLNFTDIFSWFVDSSDTRARLKMGTSCPMHINQGPNAFFMAGGTYGLGGEIATVRAPSGTMEINNPNSAAVPVLVVSASSTVTADLLQFRTGSTVDYQTGNTGSVSARVKANGGAEFSTLKLNSYTYASLAALTPVAGMDAYITDGSVVHAGNSGTVAAGGGANFVPVYYDGSVWRIK